MFKRILESNKKKSLENIIRKVGGESSVAAVKKFGRMLIYKRFERLKRSSVADIERLKARKPSLLHFGCGSRVMRGWANIDVAGKDFIMDYVDKNFLTQYPMDKGHGTRDDYFQIDFTEAGIPLPDCSITGIFHEDFLEHLSQRDAVTFLAETLRVLKPGAVHRVSTPDLVGSMRRNSDFKLGKAGASRREWDKHGHINVFTPKYLEEMARLIGYSQVIFTGRNESQLKPLPISSRPGNDRLDSEQIFCDLIK